MTTETDTVLDVITTPEHTHPNDGTTAALTQDIGGQNTSGLAVCGEWSTAKHSVSFRFTKSSTNDS
jgi:hypothetical protein